jgi:hypothetical protein
MATGTLVSVEEYLNTSYSPDCDYVDGQIVARNEGPSRFRVTDMCVVLAPEAEKIDDYLNFGVKFVWVIDPTTRKAHVYSRTGVSEAKDGILRTSNPDITVSLADL